ncbi:hypothetical protein HOG98_07810 [bacterium]|mgnify:FL=1|jgi:hypothetical protein|nr:hypothetical protein [bacterium]
MDKIPHIAPGQIKRGIKNAKFPKNSQLAPNPNTCPSSSTVMRIKGAQKQSSNAIMNVTKQENSLKIQKDYSLDVKIRKLIPPSPMKIPKTLKREIFQAVSETPEFTDEQRETFSRIFGIVFE